jgi:hypothetical protein
MITNKFWFIRWHPAGPLGGPIIYQLPGFANGHEQGYPIVRQKMTRIKECSFRQARWSLQISSMCPWAVCYDSLDSLFQSGVWLTMRRFMRILITLILHDSFPNLPGTENLISMLYLGLAAGR